MEDTCMLLVPATRVAGVKAWLVMVVTTSARAAMVANLFIIIVVG